MPQDCEAAGSGWEVASAKEWPMLPIVVWQLQSMARCDNMAVVATLHSGSCKQAHTMQLR